MSGYGFVRKTRGAHGKGVGDPLVFLVLLSLLLGCPRLYPTKNGGEPEEHPPGGHFAVFCEC